MLSTLRSTSRIYRQSSESLAPVYYGLNTKLPLLSHHHQPTASYCHGRKGFMGGVLDKIREEYKKDKHMKSSIEKFREETQKIHKSEEIKNMRSYYQKLEDNIRVDATDKLKGTVDSVRRSISEQEYLNKAAKTLSSTAEKLGDQVSKSAERLSDSDILKRAKSGASMVEREIEGEHAIRVYSRPTVLLTREQVAGISDNMSKRVFDPNESEQNVVLHKDSRWSQAWSSFRDSNPYMQKLFDMKTQYDESENPVVRGTRFLTERFRSLFGGVLADSEFQEVLTEIAKMETDFSVNSFALFCHRHIIPNVLEAMIQGDLKVLESWCYEAPFNILSQPIKNAQKLNCVQDSRVLDISLPEVTLAKIMDQGPVLVITFQTQQISAVRDSTGKVIEGDPDKIFRFMHVWALCRDPNDMNPRSAWRVLEVAMMPSEQWI